MTAAHLTHPDSSWRSPPEFLALGWDEVHVWQASLDRTSSEIGTLRRTLATDERAKVDRFHFERDRDHFIAARGMLRAILGHYLKRAPEGLSFRYGPQGKPALASEFDGDAIRFNVSHSHGVALYAVSRGREVGIDIERIRSDVAVDDLAERFFSRREVVTLQALPTELQRHAFFGCWTRKEAYIKARGKGLSLPLDQFEVSLAPGEPAALLGDQRDSAEALRWSIQDLPAAPGYMAALAAEGHEWNLARWQWPDQGPWSVSIL